MVDTKAGIEYRASISDSDWFEFILNSLNENGFAVLEGVIEESLLKELEKDSLKAHSHILSKFSEATLIERKEFSTVRLPMLFSDGFYQLLENPYLLRIVKEYISHDAILRNQSSQIVFPEAEVDEGKTVFTWFHQNFRHISFVPGLCLDCLIPLSDLTMDNGVVIAVPGSHKWKYKPDINQLEAKTVPITVGAGGLMLTDGMVWHREKQNSTSENLIVIIHQFVHRCIKQHIDYPRAIGKGKTDQLSIELQNLLGCNSVPPTSLEEYFNPKEDRTYKNILPGEESVS